MFTVTSHLNSDLNSEQLTGISYAKPSRCWRIQQSAQSMIENYLTVSLIFHCTKIEGGSVHGVEGLIAGLLGEIGGAGNGLDSGQGLRSWWIHGLRGGMGGAGTGSGVVVALNTSHTGDVRDMGYRIWEGIARTDDCRRRWWVTCL